MSTQQSKVVAGMLTIIMVVGMNCRAAVTNYVAQAGQTPMPNYTNWADASSNIQDAINVAIAGDTVLVSNGTYNLTNQISITANITVRSFTEQGHGTNDTIVDGGYPDRTNGRCFYMTAGTLDGFTIRNGYTNTTVHGYGGGGIKMGGSVNVFNCYIYSNQAISVSAGWSSGGGGINAQGFAGIISNCTIVGNDGYYGGGIQAYPCSGGLIVGCRVSGNWANRAGGVYANDGVIIITDCTVDGNTANNTYGGMMLSNLGGLITDCVISNNACTNGAGGGVVVTFATLRNSLITRNTASSGYAGVYMIAAAGGVTLVSNCLVTANSAGADAGGIYLNGNAGTGVIANCTISGNSGGGWASGVYIVANGTYPQLMKNCLVYGSTGAGAGVRITEIGQYPYGLINCTIADNLGTLGWGLRVETGTNNYIGNCIVYGTGSTIFNTTAANTNNYWYNCTTSTIVAGQGNTTNNPLFIDAVNGNYRLGANSPCVNTGTNMEWMTNAVDLDGRTRIRYGTVDMGAYERINKGTIFSVH